ncbi:Uncharacterised protein [Mycobacteroides abscessus subsp. abscessus]|nr:Uncharacterised protein [Mycobacteroides abscessus subsp. abscessus]
MLLAGNLCPMPGHRRIDRAESPSQAYLTRLAGELSRTYGVRIARNIENMSERDSAPRRRRMRAT